MGGRPTGPLVVVNDVMEFLDISIQEADWLCSATRTLRDLRVAGERLAERKNIIHFLPATWRRKRKKDEEEEEKEEVEKLK